MRRPLLASVLLLTTLLTGETRAQVAVSVPEAGTLEVASIKESQENRGGALSIQPGGRFVATNIRVRDMVNMAFRTNPGLLSQQIIGLPPWTITTRYNVEARFSGDETTRTIDRTTSADIVGAYVRALLDNRFAFRAHLEKREMPVYVVTVAQNGFKPPASVLDCSNSDNFSQCDTTYASGRLASHHLDFAVLLNQLSSVTGRPLIDQSGLKGQFDIDLQWNPEQLTDANDARPSIFGAVQELGLKLESGKGLVDALVIDRVEQPSPD
jgi:uncharacterized protein (TIGR03435 family)